MNARLQSTTITATVVSQHKRLAFLPAKFPRYFMRIERATFRAMTMMDPTYDGGYWEFYDLSNGGCYLALRAPLDKRVRLIAPNQNDHLVSYDAAGIVATLYALNELCNATEKEAHVDAYYLLRDYARQHAEWDQIGALIN